MRWSHAVTPMIAFRQFLVLLAALRRSFFQKELGQWNGDGSRAAAGSCFWCGGGRSDTALGQHDAGIPAAVFLDMRAVFCSLHNRGRQPSLPPRWACRSGSGEGGTLGVLRHEPFAGTCLLP